jgi:RND family efflux transporter MFP subunit
MGGIAITFITMSKPSPQLNHEHLAGVPKVKVAIQAATREQVVMSVKSQGTVEAKRQINLVAQVSGLIVKVDKQFYDGNFFDKNSVLIEIDDRDYRTELLSAKLRLAQAQRNLAEEKGRVRQARREWKDLGNQEANELFLRTPQLNEANSAEEYAQSEVDIAQLNIERTKIKVPFDGRIEQAYVNVGQFVSAGSDLASVYDTSIVEVRLPLSDKQLALLNIPMTESDFDIKPPVILSGIVGGIKHEWQGIITRTEASLDTASQLYYAIVEVLEPFETSGKLNNSAPLIPGLFVHAKISGKQLNDVIVLPHKAIVKRANIYTLDENNAIEIQPITLLNKNGEHVWIQSSVPDNTPILLEKHAVVSVGKIIEPVIDKTFVASTMSDGE